jgi:hydrogenase expression/formation protein HypC
MCLGIPGKVLQWTVHDPLFGRAIVEFGGIQKECQMACVPDAQPGEYVLVHAGLALCRINASEAERTLRELGKAGLMEISPEHPGNFPSTLLAES